jgi:hypothetical protein
MNTKKETLDEWLRANAIDWSKFDGDPKMTVTCANDHVYRSHAKAVKANGHMQLVARQRCPSCDTHQLRAARSDPEHFTIGSRK